ncbi:hypothetical protein B0H13DRAFT_2139728 [Mycena leptocephala]|nr:hypothetical protein B0H13DRAFT_2139728 [Mycena leptocephala]
MLSILSIELLQEIGSESFRAVSKDIGLCINPLFFADFVLKTQQLHLETVVDILMAIASGETGWSPYAKSMKIVQGRPPETGKANISDEAIQNLLAAALGTMLKVRTVDDVGDLELLPLSSLRKLKITTPYWKEIPIIEKVPRLVEQNLGLISLHLSGCGGSAWPGVWNMLRRSANHHLKDIRARYSSELFECIASYSGIEKLGLQYPDLGDPNIFFHSLLPLHAASLVELSYSASYECRWTAEAHFTISINEADIAVPVNAVEHLLRTATTLPALLSLTRCSANSERNRGARCGNPAMNHSRRVNKAITTVVQKFRCNCPYPVTVRVGSNSFELKSQDVVWGYHPIGLQLVFDW